MEIMRAVTASRTWEGIPAHAEKLLTAPTDEEDWAVLERRMKLKGIDSKTAGLNLSALASLRSKTPKAFKQVDKQDLEDYVIKLREAGLAPSTVARYTQILHGQLHYLQTGTALSSQGAIASEKKCAICGFKVDLKSLHATSPVVKDKYITPQQMQAIGQTVFRATPGPHAIRRITAIALMIDCCGRPVDLLPCRIGDIVDAETGSHPPRWELPAIRLGLKGKPGGKIIDLRPWSAIILKDYIENSHPTPDNTEAFLFPSRKGYYLSNDWLALEVSEAFRVTGIDLPTRPYLLRHTGQSWNVLEGLSEQHQRQRMRHTPHSNMIHRYNQVGEHEARLQRLRARGQLNDEPSEPFELLAPLECELGHVHPFYRDICPTCALPLTKRGKKLVTESPQDETTLYADGLINSIASNPTTIKALEDFLAAIKK